MVSAEAALQMMAMERPGAEASKPGAVAGRGAGMADLFESLEVIQKKPEAVIDGMAIGKRAGLLHQLKHGRMQFAGGDVVVPFEQVAHGGEKSSISVNVLEGHFLAPLRLVPSVGDGAVGNDAAEIVAPLG